MIMDITLLLSNKINVVGIRIEMSEVVRLSTIITIGGCKVNAKVCVTDC